MTKSRRILDVFQGALMILFAAFLVLRPDVGLYIVLLVFGIGMTLRGIRALYYYFTMARCMVGGQFALYRGIIYLDAGIFTSALANYPAVTIVIYIAVINVFAGVVDILHGVETKRMKAPRWKFHVFQGGLFIVLAVLVLISGVLLKQTDLAVYVYALGLLFAAAGKIAGAFRRTAMVYIQ